MVLDLSDMPGDTIRLPYVVRPDFFFFTRSHGVGKDGRSLNDDQIVERLRNSRGEDLKCP